MLLRRARYPGRDRFLVWKLASFVLGSVLGLIGMWREDGRLVNTAIAVVLVGFLLRFLPQASGEDFRPPSPSRRTD